GIYYFLPDPIGVETVRNEIKKELGEKANTQENPTTKTESNPNSNEKVKKETNQNQNQNKTPIEPPPSTNAHAEWIMRNQQ
ncbi:hypothetical protein, partial [Pseudomonas aeruginosa]